MGMLIAVAFLLRHDHGAYIGVASAVCVVVSAGRNWRAAVVRAGLLTLASRRLSRHGRSTWRSMVGLSTTSTARWSTRASRPMPPASQNGRVLLWCPVSRCLVWRARIGRLRKWNGRHDVTEARGNRWNGDTASTTYEKRDGAHVYYVRDASPENIRALADDPSIAGTVGLGRVQRPLWRELLVYLSPLRLAPALHNLQNAQTWLFWLFWTLPVVAMILAGWRGIHGRERWPGELAAVVGLSAMTLLVNSGFLRDPLSRGSRMPLSRRPLSVRG